MKRKFKGLFSLLLIIVMTLSIAVPAGAAQADIFKEKATMVDLDDCLLDIDLSDVSTGTQLYYGFELPSAGKLQISFVHNSLSSQWKVYKAGGTGVKYSYDNTTKVLSFNADSSGTYYVIYNKLYSFNKISIIPTFTAANIPGLPSTEVEIDEDIDDAADDIKNDEDEEIPVKQTVVSLNCSLKQKQTIALTTAELRKAKKVTWKSSNSKVAKVSSVGKITGVKKGTATITGTAGSYKMKITIKVTK